MKIKPRPHKKDTKTKAYYAWLAEPPPRRRARLPQLNKANRKMRSIRKAKNPSPIDTTEES